MKTFMEEVGEYCSYPEEPLYISARKVNIDTDKIKQMDSFSYEAGRWSIPKEEVYKIDDRYVSIGWSNPATEMQSGQPTDMTINEVEPVEVTKVEYKLKNKDGE